MYMSFQRDIENDKVNEIIESIKNNGWQGAPIVVWGDVLITGNHRYAACVAIDADPEVITLEEVFEEDGINFDEAHAEANYPAAGEDLSELLNNLSDEIIAKYDIQF